uniref:DUF2442 domain-containing protein n=1 Tax=Candidatus Kentrum sp. DK TaxID=2126562 RepID=A0A450T856_9GAMM|nr:MAG: Protein of unknown function (DUF2442) [Candidatus Kentron sp. DK]
MKIARITPQRDGFLTIVAENGRSGSFDVRPYMKSRIFGPLKDWAEFSRVRNGGYFVAWRCGADLSADTIEACWESDGEQKPT